MAELKEAEARRIMNNIFLPEYNKMHKTNYFFYKFEPEEDKSCDILCVDKNRSNGPLKIQYTKAGSDEEIERERPALVNHIVGKYILDNLRRTNTKGLFVSLNIDNPPKEKSRIEFLGETLWDMVNPTKYIVPSGGMKRIFQYRRNLLDYPIKSIKEFVSDFDLLQLEDQNKPSQVGYGSSRIGDAFLDATQRALLATLKKVKKIGRSAQDLVLLIDFDVLPYSPEYDLVGIKEEMAKAKPGFCEIWVLNDWRVPGQRTDRVWVRNDGNN